MSDEKESFQFWSNQEDLDKLRKVAKKQNRTISNALNCAIKEYNDKYDN